MSHLNMPQQNLPNGIPPQIGNFNQQGKLATAAIFNGVSSTSSRDSSPGLRLDQIPYSQLPPTKNIPSSQLPPSNSPIHSVTQKVSQLTVTTKPTDFNNSPSFTSTPNQSLHLKSSDINLGSNSAFSPIQANVSNKTVTNEQQERFQDVPLNGDDTTSSQESGKSDNSYTQILCNDAETSAKPHGFVQQNYQKVSLPQQPQDSSSNLNINSHVPAVSVNTTQLLQKENAAIHSSPNSQFSLNKPTSYNFPNVPSSMWSNTGFTTNGHPVQVAAPPRNFVQPPTELKTSQNLIDQSLQAQKMSPTLRNPNVNPSTQTRLPSSFQQPQLSHGPSAFQHAASQAQIRPNTNISNNKPMFSQSNQQFLGQSQSQSQTLNPPPAVSSIISNQVRGPMPPLNVTSQPNQQLLGQTQPQNRFLNQPSNVPNKVSTQVRGPLPPFNVASQSNQQLFTQTQPQNVIQNQGRGPMPPFNAPTQPPTFSTLPQNNPPSTFPPVQPQPPAVAMRPPFNVNSPTNQPKPILHNNRYPTIANQSNNYQKIQSQMPFQNQQPQINQQQQFTQPPVLPNQQPNICGPGMQSTSPQNNYPQGGFLNQSFNQLWGHGAQIDLLQVPTVLPPGKIDPPSVVLGQQTLNSANCSQEIFRATMTKIPESNSLLQKSRLPLGVLIHPFKDLTHLPVIQCNVIVRCRACRTYINPFVFFVDAKRWKCNLCYRVNELPEEFQYDPVSKTYGDPSRRPEIRNSTIEYIAPAEYMLRPPQPAVYLFLLDVSRLAVESGYLLTICSVLQQELKNLPGDSRTQIGFITYDSCLHFYSFADGLSQPHEMTVLDVDDVFLPCPDNLLVNLKDRIEMLEDLLAQLPNRYNNSFDDKSALGAALQVAHKMMSATGGRVTVFQAALPNVGPGALTAREDPSNRASSDVQHLNPANDFYKRLSLECSSQQISVDVFFVNSQYVDIATISGISRFSGGSIHHFPLFKSTRQLQSDGLERCFRRYLTRKIGFEAVMRVRCTRGMSIHTFHGNFFVRSTDLLSLPNVNPDSGYGMQVSIEESLSDVETVCFQAALLYTSSKGERRIRVHTLCLPVVSTLQDVINSADQQCIIGVLSKMAVDRSIESSLSDAREAFINVVIDILASYKVTLNLGSNVPGLLAPDCLRLLPLYISALLKNTAFRIGSSTRLDDRVKAMLDMKTKPLGYLLQQVYPDLYPVHNLENCELVVNNEEEQIHVAPHLQLSSRFIDSKGAYLLDTGDHMMLYVASGIPPGFLGDVLGVPNFNALTDQICELPVLENPSNQRLHSFINYLNDEKPFVATLQIIKDNSPIRSVFLERLIEDRVENALSYHEFLQHVKTQVK